MASKEVIKSDSYTDSSADTFIISSMVVGEENFIRLTFVRHVLDPQSFPDSGEEIPMKFYTEALQSVTLPLSAAKNLSAAIAHQAGKASPPASTQNDSVDD